MINVPKLSKLTKEVYATQVDNIIRADLLDPNEETKLWRLVSTYHIYGNSKKCRKYRNKNEDFHFAKYFMNILSQYPSWIHPGKFSGENPLCKITPRRKTFGFFTSPTIKCITYFTPGKNTPTLIVPSEFLDFTQWVLILPLWYYRYSLVCGIISLESRQYKVTLPPEI